MQLSRRDWMRLSALGLSGTSLSGWFPALAGPLEPLTRIAWPWYVLIGTSITMATGIISSFTHSEPDATALASRERAA